MALYQDQIEKIKYLRDRISSSLVKIGTLPTDSIIEKRIADIDTKLALFQFTAVDKADKFDTDTFNDAFIAIYHDLVILYKLAYYYSVERFNETQEYIDMHLAQLQAYASKYNQKAEFESNNTTIGDTLFFQGNGFSPITSNYTTTLSLGEIAVNKGSKVAFYIEGNTFDLDNATFYLGDKLSCSPYELNGDYLEIPGTPTYNVRNITYSEDIQRTGMFALEDTDFTPLITNRYKIYGGKNKITETARATTYFCNKVENTALNLNNMKGRVSFYIIDGSYFSIEFDKEPLSKNFATNSLQMLSAHHYITFEYEDDITFDFVTDGTVYATCKTGVINGSKLYYPSADNDISDFRVEEYGNDDKVKYELTVKIRLNTNQQEPYINMVAAKELSSYDEVTTQ